jgi:hypothetical protein
LIPGMDVFITNVGKGYYRWLLWIIEKELL